MVIYPIESWWAIHGTCKQTDGQTMLWYWRQNSNTDRQTDGQISMGNIRCEDRHISALCYVTMQGSKLTVLVWCNVIPIQYITNYDIGNGKIIQLELLTWQVNICFVTHDTLSMTSYMTVSWFSLCAHQVHEIHETCHSVKFYFVKKIISWNEQEVHFTKYIMAIILFGLFSFFFVK